MPPELATVTPTYHKARLCGTDPQRTFATKRHHVSQWPQSSTEFSIWTATPDSGISQAMYSPTGWQADSLTPGRAAQMSGWQLRRGFCLWLAAIPLASVASDPPLARQ